ncbi:hypothetical protein F2Q69_00037583 [Brassica cretica]|uniref:Uncharacterized protein n=1 Tax=Brassica cretica TaxID=69181 RepID=A0A8S9SKQ1_BRACR|nr:hypothetical protein F2Q69_00037583 [Brassica cretica]
MAELRTEIEKPESLAEKKDEWEITYINTGINDVYNPLKNNVDWISTRIDLLQQYLDTIRKKDPQPATSIDICTITLIDIKFAAMEDRSLKEISSELTIRGRYEEEAIVRCTSSAVDRYRREASTIEDYDRSMYILYHRSMSRREMRDLVPADFKPKASPNYKITPDEFLT